MVLFHKRFIKLLKRNKDTITLKNQPYFLTTFGELLDAGFNYQEVMNFLVIIYPKNKKIIMGIKRNLAIGIPLSEVLLAYRFSPNTCMQIRFCSSHGHLSKTLITLGEMDSKIITQKKLLKQTLMYPLFLIGMVTLIFISMKQILFPQLMDMGQGKGGNQSIIYFFIQHSGTIVLVFMLAICVLFILFRFMLQKKNAIQLANIYTKMPLLGRLFRSYYTYLLATEWSKLFQKGQSFIEIIEVMEQAENPDLIKEMAKRIGWGLNEGQSLEKTVSKFLFIRPELTLILTKGAAKGKLAAELQLYAKKCHEELIADLNKRIKMVQPILFLLIALLIVLVYGALLLPMYDMMGDFI